MPAEEQATVLIVDDEAPLVELYAAQLDDRHETRTATSGQEALEQLDETVGVVLLDRRMPTMDGDVVLERLRDRGYVGPVGMVTAVEPDFDIIEMGFDGYLRKPVDGDELRTFVDAMHHRGAYDETIREYFSLLSKVATIEAEKSDVRLEQNEEYAELLDRIASIKDDAREALDDARRANEFDALLDSPDVDDGSPDE